MIAGANPCSGVVCEVFASVIRYFGTKHLTMIPSRYCPPGQTVRSPWSLWSPFCSLHTPSFELNRCSMLDQTVEDEKRELKGEDLTWIER